MSIRFEGFCTKQFKLKERVHHTISRVHGQCFTGLELGLGLGLGTITNCAHSCPAHPSNLWIMSCETVASPIPCLIVTISSIRIHLLTGALLGSNSLRFFVYFFVFVFCAHVCCASLKVIVVVVVSHIMLSVCSHLC